MTTFADLNLNPKLLAALEAAGLTQPTPVQAQTIPSALQGRDVMGCAQTGTGKTAAFVLPALHTILSGPSAKPQGRGPRVLVLTPTRELAQQVNDTVKKFSAQARVKAGVIVGGVSYGPQYALLRDPLDMLVATPGRLIDHVNEGKVDFSRVQMVVLDEADRMLDMGFLKPVERILAAITKTTSHPHMMLLSATFTPSVEKFARAVLSNPLRVELAPARTEHTQITQHAFRADNPDHKLSLLNALLAGEGVGQVIVFSATKYGSEKLSKKLEGAGHASAALHGGMKQNARNRTLAKVHAGAIKVLVATDVAARGIDVKQLSHVINFDLPQVAEDYVHRIGRTGRAGETGIAISLVSPSDVPMLRDIEKLLGKRIELSHMVGLEPQMASGDFDRQGAAAPRSRKGQRQNFAGDASPASRPPMGRGGAPRGGYSAGSGRMGGAPSARYAGERSGFGGRSDNRSEGRFEPRAPRTEGRAEGRVESRPAGRSEGHFNPRSGSPSGAPRDAQRDAKRGNGYPRGGRPDARPAGRGGAGHSRPAARPQRVGGEQ